MEWVTLSGGVPCLSLISLGTLYKNKYYISDECLCKYITFLFPRKAFTYE